MRKIPIVVVVIALVLCFFTSCGELSICDPCMIKSAAKRTCGDITVTTAGEFQWEKDHWKLDDCDWINSFYSEVPYINPYTVKSITFCNSIPEKVSGGYDLSYLNNGNLMGYYKKTDETVGIGAGETVYYFLYDIYIVGEKFVANYYCDYMFSQFINLETITGLDLIDTSSTVSMRYMFQECKKLKSVGDSTSEGSSGLTNWDVSNVTDMTGLFYDCYVLESADLSAWNPERIQIMDKMFYGCRAIKEIDLSSFTFPSKIPRRTEIFSYVPANNNNTDPVTKGTPIYVFDENDWDGTDYRLISYEYNIIEKTQSE